MSNVIVMSASIISVRELLPLVFVIVNTSNNVVTTIFERTSQRSSVTTTKV